MARAPYDVRLNAEEAERLAKQGASLLLLDAPESLSFGIDLQMFVVGPKFKGLKLIPPGPHFVFYSVSNKEGNGNESSAVTGFFLFCTMSQVFVRRWDAQEERFVKLSDSEEQERYALAVRQFEFDANLGPYDIHRLKHWQEISRYVTPEVIERLEPVGGDISVMAEAELVDRHPQTAAERRMVEHLAKAKEAHAKKFPGQILESQKGGHDSSGRCFYTRLPRLVKRTGAGAADLTSLNMDKSAVLETVLRDHYKGSEDLLLGELQFAFIAFLMGQSLVSFSQWKAIVSLMLGCQEAPLRTRTRLFVKFLEVVYHQMKESLMPGPAETSSDGQEWFSGDSFFGLLLKEFLATLKATQPVDGELLFQAKRLASLVENCLGWDLDNEVSYTNTENDEFAPVVVDLMEP